MARFAKVSFYCTSAIVAFAGAIFALANLWVLSYRPQTDIAVVLPREYALVLGTSKFTFSGMVNPYYRYRILAASELYLAGKVKKIILSGDNSTRYYNEPETMRTDLIESGVPNEDIILDFAGFSTLDSVARCKNKFGVKNPIIVTQKYHLHRALFLANHYGMDGAIGYSAKAPEGASFRVRNESREALARVKAVLDAKVFGTKPKFEQ